MPRQSKSRPKKQPPDLDKGIKKLVNETTIVSIEKRRHRGKAQRPIVSRFQSDQGQQVDLTMLEPYWKLQFAESGDKRNEQRPMYSFLYDTFKAFYYSFYQLKQNKVSSINSNNKGEIVLFTELAGANLIGVYASGKKCIDILKVLPLHKKLGDRDVRFLNQFSQTRNWIIEHNYNPRCGELNFKTEPIIWSLASTDSRLTVNIHIMNVAEYTAIVDYYKDYYRLEAIMVKLIKSFPRRKGHSA